jgi:hypothetical protein
MGNEYRIVKDRWGEYVPQVRRWWWPLWSSLCVSIDGFRTPEGAENYARWHADPLVKHLGRLP